MMKLELARARRPLTPERSSSRESEMHIDELYRSVTAAIVAELEKGAAPWVKPWTADAVLMPQNAITGRLYNGINVLILWMTAQARLYRSNRWLTFQQSLQQGACVRKGEKGTHVVLVKRLPQKEDEEEKKPGALMRTFTVFNVDQVDGLEASQEPVGATRTPIMPFALQTGAKIEHGHPMACYVPSRDLVCMPNAESFTGEEHYHATLLHELTHWTAHESRLNRDLKGRFGSKAYAAEELIAELGAAFLCAHLGINGELRHAGYIGNWLELLKEDQKAIFTAAAKASQAADFLRAFS